MARAVRAFAAMGTTCEVTIDAAVGAQALADLAVRRVELLEDCWSRFRPTSELSRLNARAGSGPVQVSSDLNLLVTTMRRAWERTSHLCDPTVLQSIRDAGYDADFSTVIARESLDGASAGSLAGVIAKPSPGMAHIEVDGDQVSMPTGVGIDPGAIGKGLGADLVVEELMAAGAMGVMVNLGGDLRFAGYPGEDPAWVVSIADERLPLDAERALRWISFDPGTSAAVATSTTSRRRWPGQRGLIRHHIIDPTTGEVADIELLQATVIADEGWWAEAAATAALLLGEQCARTWLESEDLSYVLIDRERVHEPSIGATHG
jgi:thiamine biosynthesis lipoprotein